VVPRLGARALLRLQPGLLQGVLGAMRSAAACSAAAQLWAALLAQLQKECQAAAEGELNSCQTFCFCFSLCPARVSCSGRGVPCCLPLQKALPPVPICTAAQTAVMLPDPKPAVSTTAAASKLQSSFVVTHLFAAMRADHDASGVAAWRAKWQPPLLAALCGGLPASGMTGPAAAAGQHNGSGDDTTAASQLRANVSVYALPAALRLDPDSLPLLLQELLRLQQPQVPFRVLHSRWKHTSVILLAVFCKSA
jgi:hypothetical protein